MLINSYLGGWRWALITAILTFSLVPAYSQAITPSFDQVKGFKPAQRDLTEIYLQLAESLQVYGSPLPYLRHVKAEHNRIGVLYQKKYGQDPVDYCPGGMTDEFLTQMSENWDHFAPNLDLGPLSKKVGRLMVQGIKGSNGTNTLIVKILNQHQKTVFDSMVKGSLPIGFKALQTNLYSQLEWDKVTVTNGSDAQTADAVSASQSIHKAMQKLFIALDEGLSKEDSSKVKAFITGVMMDTANMAESELKIGIVEWVIDPSVEPAGRNQTAGYNAENENGLADADKKALAKLLSKDKFSRSDFAELDRFYKSYYDKLSEQGKAELDKRVWAGTRAQ